MASGRLSEHRLPLFSFVSLSLSLCVCGWLSWDRRDDTGDGVSHLHVALSLFGGISCLLVALPALSCRASAVLAFLDIPASRSAPKQAPVSTRCPRSSGAFLLLYTTTFTPGTAVCLIRRSILLLFTSSPYLQIQYTISYHIISYHIISYHIISYLVYDHALGSYVQL
jgi:hypothetical protein